MQHPNLVIYLRNMLKFISVYALARCLLLLLLAKSCLFVARHPTIAVLLIQKIHLIQLYIIVILLVLLVRLILE